MGPRVLVIDNYDSFVYNLVQYLGELGALPLVHRHDALDLDQVDELAPDAVLVSPGPGRPEDAGLSNQVIAHLAGRVPVLGVCLGHQCIGFTAGAVVERAGRLMHGKTDQIHHDGLAIYDGMPNPFTATRYHSLIIRNGTLPPEYEVTAWTDQDEIMGVRHKSWPMEGVQYHPESFLTEQGERLLANFLKK